MTVVSFEHGFLFIKTRKVAGTSVEAQLRSCTGPGDIVTPLTPRDEHYCAGLGLHARHYARDPADEAKYRALVLNGEFDAALAHNRQVRKRYASHMPARILSRRLGRQAFSRLFRFSLERNPFSWLVSVAAHDTEAYNAGAMAALDAVAVRERIFGWLSRHRGLEGSNYPYYTVRGRLAVDRVLRYEHLAQDLEDVLGRLGIEPAIPLPGLKVSPAVPPLSEIYTPALVTQVLERFDPVFELVGYPRRVPAGQDGPDEVSGAGARRSTDRPTSPQTAERADHRRTSGRVRPAPG